MGMDGSKWEVEDWGSRERSLATNQRGKSFVWGVNFSGRNHEALLQYGIQGDVVVVGFCSGMRKGGAKRWVFRKSLVNNMER